MFGRIDRLRRDAGAGDGGVPHRAPGGRRRAVRADRRRLAGAGRRAVLPGHRRASRWASSGAATSPSRVARCSASRTSCSATATSVSATTTGSSRGPQPDGALGAARLLHADRRARARPHGHARRHRRHDPGRAGRDHPLAAGRRARRAGRPGHRQDGRRAAPRRLPALHPPLPARGPGRARHRPEPGVPALHRAGPAVARRGRRRAGRARRPRARRELRPRRRAGRHGPSPPRVKGDARMSDVIDKAVADRQRPLRDDVRVPFRTGYVRLAADDTARIVQRGPPPLPAPQRRPPLRRGRGLRRDGRVVARRAGARRTTSARRCATTPRCAPRSSACGRCSRRPSCCTTCSARRRCCAWPARGVLDGCRDRGPVPAARRRRGRRALDAGRRRAARRRPRRARPAARQGRQDRRRATRSAPTATSSSTRSRTSRRCSSRWRPAGR